MELSTINCNKDKKLVAITREGCSAMETATLAFEKASYVAEMASQKWSIPIQTYMQKQRKKKGWK